MYLNSHTYYSLRYGVLDVKKLVQLASDLHLSSLALTDINNTSCTIEFVNACKQYGIDPVIGIEFRDEQDFLYIGLAHGRSGFAQLNQMLDRYLVEGQPLPRRAPSLPGVSFIYDYRQVLGTSLDVHEYAGVRPSEIHHWYRWQHHFPADRCVAWMPVTLASKQDWPTHQLLRCIALGTIASKLSRSQCCQPDEYMVSSCEVDTIYRTYPHLVNNSRRLLSQCVFDQSAGAHLNKEHYLDSFYHDQELLTQLSLLGLRERYPVLEPYHRLLLRKELEMIFRLRFEAYFLIAWDIVEYARKAGYRHVGRGSGANSLVAYCLHITDVDPIALNLYFERFINPHRPVPPDFDLDFSWDERDDVIRYIQGRHGHHRVGLLASYQTFKGKSVVRELGKVLGLTPKEIDLIVRHPRAKSQHHPLADTIFREGRRLLGLPNHLSIHSGGIVITESSLQHLTASQLMPKGFAIAQIDMHHAAEWGLHKFDILSQRGTGHIKEAVQIVEQKHCTRIDIGKMSLITGDKKTFELLRMPGGCIGCFYIESPAMRALLAKVPCNSYQDLVAVSSIIRPGVSKSGMMQQYIERFHDSSKITHVDPQLADLLKDTFGIMVYQEDVMKVVHHLAHFSLYESDLLRRLMTGKEKTSESLQYLKDRFFANCTKLGRSKPVVTELWRQIESFSGYAFCKAHSATYAAESLQSLFLKAHYPIEFMVAVINNEGGFYPMEVYVRELIRLGGKVEAPCIMHSSWYTSIRQGIVYLGLKMIKGLTRQTGRVLAELRGQKGCMKNMKLLIARMSPNQIDLLIEVGALRGLDPDRYRLFFERLLQSRLPHPVQLPIFDSNPYLHQPDIPDDQSSLSRAQLRLLGFTIGSPFLLFDPFPPLTLQAALTKKISTTTTILAYYILEKPVTTDHGAHMCFVTWYDQDLMFFDSVHFPKVLSRYPLAGKGLYQVEGRIEIEHGYPLMIVQSCRPLQLLNNLEMASPILSDYHYLSNTKK